jgi:hypothetical protein
MHRFKMSVLEFPYGFRGFRQKIFLITQNFVVELRSVQAE